MCDNSSGKFDDGSETLWLKAVRYRCIHLMKVINLEGRKAGQLTGRNQGPAKVDIPIPIDFGLKLEAALLRRVKLSICRFVLTNSA